MDLEEYRAAYVVEPPPPQRFRFDAIRGITLYYVDYEAVVDYYTRVLGPPGYVEGEGTRSWRVGDSWLTLLAGGSGSPVDVEVPFLMASPEEAERLQQAFIDAGGTGSAPSDQLMFDPVRFCPVTDPWGTNILVYAALT